MSIFTILDVISNSSPRNRLGGPGSLAGSQYNSNTYRFPLDIGNYDKGHYILFHINEQTRTQFPGTQSSDQPTVLTNMQNLMARRGATNFGASFSDTKNLLAGEVSSVISGNSTLTNIKNKMDQGVAALSSGSTLGGIVGGAFDEMKNAGNSLDAGFLRTIRRTTDTVALYMPSSLSFNYSQSYDTPHMSSNILGIAGAVASTAIEGYKINPDQLGRNLSPFFLNYLAKLPIFGKAGSAVFTASTGLVQNPMMEVLYSSPNLREFDFNFMFYPRSEKEALEVQKIIERIKFHQAPEIKSNSGGFFLIPPSEFDIKFMYNGKENPNIDKISTCVLTSISVDYAKEGFTAFEVAGENDPQLGRTGMPTGIAMSLKFKETQILTKESYRDSSSSSKSNSNNLSNVSIDEYSDNQFGTSPYGEANG
jgi:hypothetical protein